MFHHIRGEIIHLGPTRAVLESAGVGYELSIPLSSYRALLGQKESILLTHFWVREDVQRLFGFSTEAEREVFRIVITVSGVGPSIALAILSTFAADEFCVVIEQGDPKPLQRIKGVGKRLAERLMVELRDRLPALSALLEIDGASQAGEGVPAKLTSSASEEACLALVELGFSRKDAEAKVSTALSKLGEDDEQGSSSSVEEILTLALRSS